MLARLAALLALALVTPLAAALVPAAPDANAIIVTAHQAYDPSTGTYCSSTDPLASVVSTDLTSRMSAASAGGGITAFTLHLDATLPDAVNGHDACDAVDLAFTSSIAWPPTNGWNGGAFAAACGLTGYFLVYHATTNDYFQLYLDAVPPACALPVSQGYLGWFSSPAHPATALVCGPLVVPACFGAYSETSPGYGCTGSDTSRFYVTAVLSVAYVERSCHFWSDGREHVTVNDAVGFVQVSAPTRS
jgi:hypothetical protein